MDPALRVRAVAGRCASPGMLSAQREGSLPSREQVALEDRMSRWPRFVPVLAVAVLLAACGDGGPDNPLSPAPGPRFEGGGGWTVGGNATDPPPQQESTSSDPTSELPPGVPADSASRGGGWTVGGN
jgi:hypothetical protein